jgi:hypothetical protein
MDHRLVVVIRFGHHHGSRLAITNGRADAAGPLGEAVLGGGDWHRGPGMQVGCDVGGVVVGGVVVGALVVGLLVGALDVGADDCVRWVLGGGGGGNGEWPVSGGVPVTYAGSGKLSTGTPTRSAFITADQVAVG